MDKRRSQGSRGWNKQAYIDRRPLEPTYLEEQQGGQSSEPAAGSRELSGGITGCLWPEEENGMKDYRWETGTRGGGFKTMSCQEPASKRRSRVAGGSAAATSSVAEKVAPGRGDRA